VFYFRDFTFPLERSRAALRYPGGFPGRKARAAAAGGGELGQGGLDPARGIAALPARVPASPSRVPASPSRRRSALFIAPGPRPPPRPAPSVCPHARPALASSLRGARLVYLLQYRVVYKIFNKSRTFLTVTAALLFARGAPPDPSAGRGGGPGRRGGRARPRGGQGGLPGPPPLPQTQRNPPEGKVFFVCF